MATTPTAVVPSKSDQLAPSLRPLMQSIMPDVYKLLPPDITQDQFRAGCWLELTGDATVATWVVEAVREAVIYAASYGLLPGRDCHFIPYKQKKYGNKVGPQCVTNYFGVIRSLDRSGKVRRAFAHPVHDGDAWGFDYFQDRPVHQPAVTLGRSQGRELFYYGAVMFRDGTCAFEVVTLDELEATRKRAPAHDSGPWVTDPVMMRRKTAIKRVAKYVQLTPDMRKLLDDDDAREREDIPPARHQQNIIDIAGERMDPTFYVRPPATPPVDVTASPAGEAGAAYIAQIEAALVAQQRQVEPWYTQTERRFRKARTDFTETEWQLLLAEVRQAAPASPPGAAEGAAAEVYGGGQG
jgi:recombination protein RecT